MSGPKLRGDSTEELVSFGLKKQKKVLMVPKVLLLVE